MSGVVSKAAYLGSHMEYQVDVRGIPDRLFVIDPSVTSPLSPGSDVSVSFAAEGIALLGGDPQANRP